ncbi:MAG: RNA-binding cell elongation regulator Jag/EloR [Chloroflexota bacterium]
MNQETRATLEIIAPSVDEAVEKGLAELGLQREDVEIEILDEGKGGLFGLGGRQSRVRLSLKSSEEGESTPTSTDSLSTRSNDTERQGNEDEDNIRAIAQATVSELLERMDVHQARVSTRVSDAPGKDGMPGIVVDINGDDLSILIGKRAETLNALQYITRLIVGKEAGRGINLTVDVEGYRARRERSLGQLAQRMAGQAVKSGRRQTLEPMPANERRLIHIELKDNDQVTTESVGEEPRRKVTIIPTNE